MLKSVKSLVFVSLFAVHSGWAQAKECLQAPSRTTSCPHIIYKRAAIAVPALDIDKHEVICICLSDISRNYNPEIKTIDNVKQQVLLQRMATSYGLNEEDIVKLVKY